MQLDHTFSNELLSPSLPSDTKTGDFFSYFFFFFYGQRTHAVNKGSCKAGHSSGRKIQIPAETLEKVGGSRRPECAEVRLKLQECSAR